MEKRQSVNLLGRKSNKSIFMLLFLFNFFISLFVISTFLIITTVRYNFKINLNIYTAKFKKQKNYKDKYQNKTNLHVLNIYLNLFIYFDCCYVIMSLMNK